MRLLHTSKFVLYDYDALLKQQNGKDVIYTILSHRWLDEEVIFDDMCNFAQLRKDEKSPKSDSVKKVEGACRVANANGYDFIWLDICCIDQKNPLELSTAINSMYRWYKNAKVCFAHLQGYDSTSKSSNAMDSIWFKRGWTLQELVAPTSVDFFDENWKPVGNKIYLQDEISKKTGIDREILSHDKGVGRVSVAHRMSWFKGRVTKVPEDNAYCLMGLFGVNMPTLYGEGMERAFRRLQEEIIKNSDDHSIFAWRDDSDNRRERSGMLAPSPKCFEHTGDFNFKPNRDNILPFAMTNKGLSINLYVMEDPKHRGTYLAALDCPAGDGSFLGIYLECESPEIRRFSRIRSGEFCRIGARGPLRGIYIPQPIDI